MECRLPKYKTDFRVYDVSDGYWDSHYLVIASSLDGVIRELMIEPFGSEQAYWENENEEAPEIKIRLVPPTETLRISNEDDDTSIERTAEEWVQDFLSWREERQHCLLAGPVL